MVCFWDFFGCPQILCKTVLSGNPLTENNTLLKENNQRTIPETFHLSGDTTWQDTTPSQHFKSLFTIFTTFWNIGSILSVCLQFLRCWQFLKIIITTSTICGHFFLIITKKVLFQWQLWEIYSLSLENYHISDNLQEISQQT